MSTSFRQNLGTINSMTATSMAYFSAHPLDDEHDLIKLDKRLEKLCGRDTLRYRLARRFVFDGEPSYETQCLRYLAQIHTIKAENHQRGHARARQIARERAGVLLDLL